jgi:polyisoprenoid-binding protein YceI
MRRAGIFIVAMSIAATNIFAVAYAADYEIDADRSELVVRLFKGGVAAAIAHNHAIRAVDYSGGAKVDPNNPETASIWIEVQTASLKADEPEVRERFGLPKGISDKDRRKIQATMLSAKQMDVEKYSTMRFRSTGVEEQSEGRYQITGDLTMHGVTRSITFPITVEDENGDLHGSAAIDFKQSDFGIKPYSAMFGALRNRDDAVLYAKIVLALGSADETEADQVVPDASHE